jgi:hypothetical protein
MYYDEYGNELPFKSIDYSDLDNAPIERCRISYRYIKPVWVGESKFSKVMIGHELYLYYEGKLLFKKWFNSTQEHVFHSGEGLTQYTAEYKRKK